MLKIDIFLNEMGKWEPPYAPALLFIPKDNKNTPQEFKSSGSEFYEEEVV